LNGLVNAEFFQNLERELPPLRAQLDQAGSVILGVNLDAQLRPESATLLQISSGRFGGPRSLLGRLLGAERAEDHGRTPLRQAGERQTFGPDRQLFLDLNQLLQEVVAPLAATLTRFSRSEGASLAALEGEIAFYLGATRLASTLREAGYELCEPAIYPPEQRLFAAEGLYNLELALRLRAATYNGTAGPGSVVANDIAFDDEGRIFLLTGPNRGGKTTFTRAVGIAQVLAQAGLPMPARSAQFSPVDGIYTLFPTAEEGLVGMGRFDEEAAKLASIFRSASAQSLVFLNEPLGSTSPHDAYLVARDLLSGLRILGARVIMVTHLHDLAREAAQLNERVTGRSTIATLVAAVRPDGSDNKVTRTYRIVRGLPEGNSYASDIVGAHGLRLEQIERTLRERRQGGDHQQHQISENVSHTEI
jgi:DNA mismatch repair ATPase MutS